jgi:single-stranded-DNA-specific exonuclease
MTKNLEKLCKKAAELIKSFPKDTRIRVISHYDADGISAATIICKAVYREGYNFHATLMRNPFDKGLERISKEENKIIIFCDMGSGQIESIEKINSKSIIIDHHQVIKEKTSDNVIQINANLNDINGNYEACGATLTYSVAEALNHNNSDLISLALVGATGDKQYIGGFKGYNKKLIEDALEKGLITEKKSIKFSGETISESLYYAIDPYFSGLSGNKEKIDELIKKIGIKSDKISDLKDETLKKLNSYLMLTLIKKGCEKNILETLIRNRFTSKDIPYEFEQFADLLDSCGKGGNRGIGLSTALGDKKSLEKAVKLEKKFKENILEEVLRLESEGFHELKNYRYFYSNNSSTGGVICGIATNFMLDDKKPLISIVKNKDEIHVSCRGNQHLVNIGLDLGSAMKQAAKKLGGHGGGHAIASGATLALEQEEEFLKLVDDIINKQLKK